MLTNEAATVSSRDELARELLPLVHEIANRVARRVPQHVTLEDLVGAGLLGLAGALERFDPERATTFKGYAEFRINGEIMDELRRRDLLSRDARFESKKLRRRVEELSRQLGRPAADDEIASYLDITLQDYRTLQQRVHDTKLVPADDLELMADEASPAEQAQQRELGELLSQHIEQLPKRLRLVLWLYYVEELPLREIGDMLGVSPSRVCQIRIEAVHRLRGAMVPESPACMAA